VGTDWGAIAGWHMSLFRPDRVKGLVTFNVPYYQRSPNTKPSESIKQMFGEESYVFQFQVLSLSLSSPFANITASL
jgi:pimeloyl-ACP methyl ester carboxylesterase